MGNDEQAIAMKEMSEIFRVYRARSKAISDHDKGGVPFVSNGFDNNGVVGLVEPLPFDRVFHFTGICVSAFGEATVQLPPFLARGNGGSGLMVLEPKAQMGSNELYWYASYINQAIKWRFSFGRMLKKERLEKMLLPSTPTDNWSIPSFESVIPNEPKNMELSFLKVKWAKSSVSHLFRVERGSFHSLARLSAGDTLTISRVAGHNGLAGYFERPEKAKMFKAGDITVSTLGADAFLQTSPFMATDNVLVLTPLQPMSIEVRTFIVYLLNYDKWRYSYGRQSYKTKFEQVELMLPVNQVGSIDEPFITSILNQVTYWPLIKQVFKGS